ncbi:MAG: hypothetical protein GOMPHAMPRED_000799 [Gomphillus americanus]|uniref:Uncharacterized protein n=1 Tax=Gomphillus americanus TaxID=1940652 RepID=A0A8H3F3Y9_9LECA|nr:MAG: hypothetical protein GOMPHAMPRED_000799 [Gomphillus americanus]
MKQIGLVVVFALPLCVFAKAAQVLNPLLLGRLAIRQNLIKSTDAESMVKSNLQHWLDISKVERPEDIKSMRVGNSFSPLIADDAVFTGPTTLYRRMESDGKDITTPKSTLSPQAAEFKPQSVRTNSPQQHQAEHIRSPPGALQPAPPRIPSESPSRAQTPTWTSAQQALLDRIGDYSNTQSSTIKSSQQSPSDRVRASPSDQPLSVIPSQQTISGSIDRLALNNPRLSSAGVPSPQFHAGGRPAPHHAVRTESRFFPEGKLAIGTPDKRLPQTRAASSPSRETPVKPSGDPLSDLSRPQQTIKNPHPRAHPGTPPPPPPPPPPPRQPSRFDSQRPRPKYSDQVLHSLPAIDPAAFSLYSMSPPWRIEVQHRQFGGDPIPMRPPLRHIPAPMTPSGAPPPQNRHHPNQPAGVPMQNPPRQQPQPRPSPRGLPYQDHPRGASAQTPFGPTFPTGTPPHNSPPYTLQPAINLPLGLSPPMGIRPPNPAARPQAVVVTPSRKPPPHKKDNRHRQ